MVMVFKCLETPVHWEVMCGQCNAYLLHRRNLISLHNEFYTLSGETTNHNLALLDACNIPTFIEIMYFAQSPAIFPITPQVPPPGSVEETSHCQGWDLRQKVSVSIYASPAFRPHPTLLLQPMMAHSLFLEKCFIAQLPPSSPGQEKFRWSLFDEKILGKLAAASDGTDRDLLDNLIVQTLVESLLAP